MIVETSVSRKACLDGYGVLYDSQLAGTTQWSVHKLRAVEATVVYVVSLALLAVTHYRLKPVDTTNKDLIECDPSHILNEVFVTARLPLYLHQCSNAEH